MKVYIDQCKQCTVRGDMVKCQQTPCNYRLAWRAQEVTALNEKLLEALEAVLNEDVTPNMPALFALIAKARRQNEKMQAMR